jgi:translation elongation factor P/translation initiation factor 5A
MQPKPSRHAALHPTRFTIMALLFIALCFLIACTTTSPPPPGTADSAAAIKEGVPGGVFVNTVEVSVKVTAVDTAKRKLTLLLPDGEKTTVKVGPEAVNFDQIRSGDLITATLTEETVIYLDAEGVSPPDGAAAMVALAPKGAQPGGLVAEVVQVTATVTAIDPAKRTATLRFEDGSTQTFPVRDDIDLSKRKVGEKVVFLVTEMIAISVEKP